MSVKAEDLRGKRFGNLVVITRSKNNTSGKPTWLCHCDCGAEKVVSASHLKSGTSSCGCANPNKKKDMVGKIIGYLTVIAPAANKGPHTAWLCRCRCGKEVVIDSGSLRSGLNKSCGCYRDERNKLGNITHGLSSTRLYRIWIGMRNRCFNPKNPSYDLYGQRGIMVCSEWLDFETFYKWAVANGYQENLTIERKDNDKGYSPDNCTWIPRPEQVLNLRTNRKITCNGITKTIHEWSVDTGLLIRTIRSRLDTLKWSAEKTLSTPAKNRRKETSYETNNA